ncbi:hypothetical protein V4U86_15510 [Mycobacterium sp. AMU20-3851]|uniref:hypothetical protein n=1 Tax=Mycobacterium sp. AMU20-3851 TaxID=3122055 RepID=UPI0037547B16
MFNPVLERWRSSSAWKLIYFPILMVLVLVAVNFFQGTLGGLHDFRLSDDFMTVTNLGSTTNPHPYFPLARDVISWVLIFNVAAGLLILHIQAKRMCSTLSSLAGSGAIRSRVEITSAAPQADGGSSVDYKATYRLNPLTRILGIDKVARRSTPPTAFGTFVERVNKICSKIKVAVVIAIVLAALTMATVLQQIEAKFFFASLAPVYESSSEDAQAAAADWVESAYTAWWASAEHPFGHTLYLVFAFIAFCVVLSFHITGFYVIYIIIGMRHLTQPSADWSNRDGYYGWRPVADVYRTVVFAVLILGFTITLMLMMLGLRNVGLVVLVLAAYSLMTFLFLIVPRWVWAEVSRTAKKNRIDALLLPLSPPAIDNPGTNVRTLAILAEVERCRSADISPLRLTTFWLRTSFTAIFFPLALAVVQLAVSFVLSNS